MYRSDFTVFMLLMTVIISIEVHWILGIAFFLAAYSYVSSN